MMKKKPKGIDKVMNRGSLKELKYDSKDGVFKELFRDWKWIFGFTRNRKGLVIFYTVFGLLVSSTSILISYIGKMLINNIVTNKYQGIVFLGLAYVLGIALNIAVNATVSRLSAKITVCVNNDIQKLIFERVIDAQWLDISSYPTGDLLNRFNSDVQTIASNAVNWIPNIIVNIYTFVITFVILWRMDIIMALISVVAAPFLLIVSRYLMQKLRKQREIVTKLNSDMMDFENEAFGNYDMIKSFGITDYYNRQLFNWQGKYHDCNMEYNKVEIKAKITMTVTSALVAVTAFAYCLYRLSTGSLLYGDMTFFLSQRSNVSTRFSNIVNAFPGLLNSAVSAQRIRELTELKPEKHDTKALEELFDSDNITVEFNNIVFSYNKDKMVYSGGNFVARPGEIVTVLGSSGEGKTTLLRMILGLVSPDSGTVMLIGSNGKKMPISADLRQLISYVPQGKTTVSGTIAENMRMVKEDASDDDIITALKTACAWEFVEKLPDGINSHIGGNAHGISTGQAQRISIARALLRNSPVLILDEATSALDIETENNVLKNIVSTCPNKTCIVSTHRPSILKQSDRIYRVRDKKLVEIDREEAKSYYSV